MFRLTCQSKHSTPDTLIVCLHGAEKIYDIRGTTDYSECDLFTRTKGILALRHEDLDDYVELTHEEEQELMDMLDNPEVEVGVAIYPCIIDNNEEAINTDELPNCYGILEIRELGCNFKFHTEFYGI